MAELHITAGAETHEMGSIASCDSGELKDAMRLHSEIIAGAELAAESLTRMCAGLKEMRDRRLYTVLGRDSFEDYVQTDIGMSARQAYTYISTYERLGAERLTEHASAGVTKLELIARMSTEGQAAALDSVDGLSVGEIRELVRRDKEKNAELQQLQEQLDKSVASGKKLDMAEIQKVREQCDDELRAQLKKAADKASAELAKEKKSADKRIKELQDQLAHIAREQEDEEFADEEELQNAAEIAELREQLTAAESRERELTRQLRTSDAESMRISIIFEALQSDYNKLLEAVRKVSDQSKRASLKTALCTALEKYKAAAERIDK